jgi:copper oxidase (laccase) domain-containing protein
MARDFGTDPADVEAAIGPCIGPCCFETDAEVPRAILAALGPEAEPLIRREGEKFFPDLKALNALWLGRMGVRRIDVSRDCTRCRPDRFWSHRLTGTARGSMAAVILLREKEADA